MFARVLRVLTIAAGVVGLAQGAAAQGAPNPCVDFSLFSDDTPLPDSFQLGGITFAAIVPAGELFINASGGEVGLQFTPDGINIGFPAAVSDVALRIGTFAGPVTVSGIDPLGNLVSPLVVPGTNTFADVTFMTHGPIVGVRLEGGGREGILRSICALSRVAELTFDNPDVPVPLGEVLGPGGRVVIMLYPDVPIRWGAMAEPASRAVLPCPDCVFPLPIDRSGSPAAAVTADTVWVFRYDGSVQCEDSTGRTLEADQAVLEGIGGHVLNAEQRGVRVIALCGWPTGAANAFEISAADWEFIEHSFVGPVGFALWQFVDERRTLDVYRPDGTVYCSTDAGIPLETMAAELTAAGVIVTDMRRGDDGLLHIQVCGAATGAINIFTVPGESLQQALDLGFWLLDPPAREPAIRGGGLPLPWPFPW